MDNITIILLIVVGFILLAIEIFLAPGFTIFGVLGIITLVMGIVLAFLNLPMIYALSILLISLLFVSLFLYWFFKAGIKIGFGLKGKESRALGFKPFRKDYQNYLGKTGITVSPLRPAGIIRVDKDKVSAISQGDFIDVGLSVKIIKVEGNKIVVEKI